MTTRDPSELSIQRANTVLYCRRWPETVAFYRTALGLRVAVVKLGPNALKGNKYEVVDKWSNNPVIVDPVLDVVRASAICEPPLGSGETNARC